MVPKIYHIHGPRNCPEFGKTCYICKGLNHYAIRCISNYINVQHITKPNVNYNEDFVLVFKIETLTKVHSVYKTW